MTDHPPLPCGHPAVCERDGACGWCADVEKMSMKAMDAIERMECGIPPADIPNQETKK